MLDKVLDDRHSQSRGLVICAPAFLQRARRIVKRMERDGLESLYGELLDPAEFEKDMRSILEHFDDTGYDWKKLDEKDRKKAGLNGDPLEDGWIST